MGETGGEGPRRLAGQNRLRLIGMGFRPEHVQTAEARAKGAK